MTKKAAVEENAIEFETEVVEELAKAHTIAEKLFGASQVNEDTVEEIYDYLLVQDEETFADDLKRTIEHTKVIYKTETPTPRAVFGVFDRIFFSDDED